MNLPSLTDVVGKDKKVRFSFYRDRELWYTCETGFQFPVSIEEAGTATFLAEDKSIYFMRWVRKHLDYLKESVQKEGLT